MGKGAETALKAYRDKRRFDETTEPSGAEAAVPGALFVIQKHAARRLHYDFRLELDGVLLSWAVTRGPSYSTKDRRLAVRTEDHPLAYGRFEGTIPAGNYGAGTVMLWDSGTWTPVGDPQKGLRDGKLVFLLHGERLQGRWGLVRMRGNEKDKKAKRENWLLIKEKDEYANTRPDLLDEADVSVASGRDFQSIAETGKNWHSTKAKPDLPPFREPMLALLVKEPPRGKEWVFEIKYDGYRALIAANKTDVNIYTRSGLDWTDKFPQIARAVSALQLDQVLLDGEIVVIDKQGHSDFAALVAALESGKGAISYFVFDLLASAGKDLTAKNLTTRQAALQKLLGMPAKDAVVQLSEVFAGADDVGEKLAASACAHGLEGIIAKRAQAPYRSGRHDDWLKIKCEFGQEFVIVGFSPSEKKRPFASVLLAVNEAGSLRYAGRVGSGFSDTELARLAKWRDANMVKKSPIAQVPDEAARSVTWVKPVMIAQVEFAGWTGDKMIRHGRYMGTRGDKDPKKIVKEMPAPAKPKRRASKQPDVAISHGERIIYPDADISKADVAAYIAQAAPMMMPFIKDRFVSFLRCPEGAEQACFFQRHPMSSLGDGWMARDFAKSGERRAKYVYCETSRALEQAVQMGVLEFHIWGARIDDVEKPDRIVFDLDPDDGLAFDVVRAGAKRLRDVLAAVDLQSLPMLSGGKGIHVVVPVRRRHDWAVVKEFAGNLSACVAADAPAKFTATMSKAKRTGKIFIDYFRNDRTATAIAPYSPRARKGAAVAWPLTWPALEAAKAANEVTIPKAVAALAAGENGWADYARISQDLSAAALRALEVKG
jgi:bifunctional non-homologous end joining protein LigD